MQLETISSGCNLQLEPEHVEHKPDDDVAHTRVCLAHAVCVMMSRTLSVIGLCVVVLRVQLQLLQPVELGQALCAQLCPAQLTNPAALCAARSAPQLRPAAAPLCASAQAACSQAGRHCLSHKRSTEGPLYLLTL